MGITRGPGTIRYVGPSKREIRQEQDRLARLAASNYAEIGDDVLDELIRAGFVQAQHEVNERKVREFLARHPELPQEVKGFPIKFTYEEGIINLDLRIPPWGVSTRRFRGAERELES